MIEIEESVITTEPNAKLIDSRTWHDSLFDCTNDPANCKFFIFLYEICCVVKKW